MRISSTPLGIGNKKHTLLPISILTFYSVFIFIFIFMLIHTSILTSNFVELSSLFIFIWFKVSLLRLGNSHLTAIHSFSELTLSPFINCPKNPLLLFNFFLHFLLIISGFFSSCLSVVDEVSSGLLIEFWFNLPSSCCKLFTEINPFIFHYIYTNKSFSEEIDQSNLYCYYIFFNSE